MAFKSHLGQSPTSILNPRAAAFSFSAPGPAAAAAPKERVQATSNPSWAAVVAQPPGAGVTPQPEPQQQQKHVQIVVEQEQEREPTPAEAAAAAEGEASSYEQQQQQQRVVGGESTPTTTHFIQSSTTTTTPRPRSSSLSSTSSIASSSSSSSNSSCYSLPSLQHFTLSHILQFTLSISLCLALILALALWQRQVRWAELLLGVVAWLAGEQLKGVLFDLFSFAGGEEVRDEEEEEEGTPRRVTAAAGMRSLGLPTLLHALLQESLRLGAIRCVVALLPPIVGPNTTTSTSLVPSIPPPRPPHAPRGPLPPLDTLFFSALWMALGWGLVEVIWASKDFWRRMKLYDEVLGEGRIVLGGSGGGEREGEEGPDKHASPEFLSESAFDRVLEGRGEGVLERQLEEEVEGRQREVEREEIERQLGVPLYEIPVAVVFVWRLDRSVVFALSLSLRPSPGAPNGLPLTSDSHHPPNRYSILLSLLLTLLLSLPYRTTSPSLIAFPLLPTFLLASTIHAFLSLLWCLRIKRVGIPSVSYATLVGVLGGLFGVLGCWGALE